MRKFFLLLAAIALVSCNNPQNTVDRLRKEIEVYKGNPTPEKQVVIDKSFIELDDQIAVLERNGDTAKAAQFRQAEASLRGDYQVAKMAKTIQDAKNAIENFGEAVKSGAQNIQDAFKATPEPTP
jgi:predicted small secreted protein